MLLTCAIGLMNAHARKVLRCPERRVHIEEQGPLANEKSTKAQVSLIGQLVLLNNMT